MHFGIKVSTNGTFSNINVDNIMEVIRPNNDYSLVERYRRDNYYILIYGTINTELPFNRYEFSKSTLNGNAFIVKISSPDTDTCEFVNLSISEFKGWYEEVINIENTDDEEEESVSEHTSDRDFLSDNDDYPYWS